MIWLVIDDFFIFRLRYNLPDLILGVLLFISQAFIVSRVNDGVLIMD